MKAASSIVDFTFQAWIRLEYGRNVNSIFLTIQRNCLRGRPPLKWAALNRLTAAADRFMHREACYARKPTACALLN
jgi:hypothetical protein